MNRILDDYKYKDLTKRVELRLVRKTSEMMSGWELSNFINTTASVYNKFEVINSIAVALNEQIQPENIFILDGSFKINKSYKTFDIIPLDMNGLYELYKIGNPVSLFPNKKLFLLNQIFRCYKNINSYLSRAKCQRLTKKSLEGAFGSFENSSFKRPIDYLTMEALGVLMQSKTKNESNAAHIKTLSFYESRIQDLKKTVLVNINDFLNLKKEGIFDNISDCLRENKEVDLKGERVNKEDILYKYYNSFFRMLKRLSRPVAGIYDEKNNKVEILCRANFIPGFQNEALLDIKSISHKSPIEVLLVGLPQLILVCIGIPISIMKLINMGLERRIKKEVLKQKQIETKIKQHDLDRKKKIEEFKKESEKLSMKEIVKIPINIINIGLRNVFVKLKEKGSEINKTNQFETKDINMEKT